MDGIVEALTRILPVALGIIWLIARTSRTVKKDGAQKPGTAPAARKRSIGTGFTIRELLENNEQPSKTPVAEAPPKKVIPPPAAPVQTQVRRVIQDIPESPPASASVKETVWDRIESLPSVGRGLVWTTILDRPPSLKDVPEPSSPAGRLRELFSSSAESSSPKKKPFGR